MKIRLQYDIAMCYFETQKCDISQYFHEERTYKGICALQQKKDKKMKLIFSVYLLVYLTSLFIKVF